MNPTEKERPRYNLWQNSAYMIGRAWRHKKSILFISLLLAILSVSVSTTELLIVPAILEKIDTGVTFQVLLATILSFTGGLLLLSAGKTYVDSCTMPGRCELRLMLFHDVNRKLWTTSYPNTEDTELNKLLEKIRFSMSTNQSSAESIWSTMTNLLTNISGFVIYLLFLSSLNPLLTAVILVTTMAGFLVTRQINQWGYRHRKEEEDYIKRMRYVLSKSEHHALAKDIRIFGMRPWLEDVYNSTLSLYQSFVARRERTYIRADILDALLSLCRNGIAYFYLVHMVLQGRLTAAEFLLYFSAVGGFTAWITGILSEFSTLHMQCLDIDLTRRYLETPEPFLFEEGEPFPANPAGAYELQLKDVCFRYPGAASDTLHNVNLTIRPGEKLAVVGLNGAGKTTMVKLLCGLYDPTAGQVLLNGQDIRRYDRRSYYRLFSAVFQQFSRLEATLTENLAQTYQAPEDSKMWDCIEKAGLTDKVNSLSDKLQSHLGREVYEDGVELSGGELQRLMLARALYKDAPIIMLDEPTAALDPIAENDIYLKYNEMTAGRTSVFISHRLASTRFCDRILFLAEGNIAEEGSHDALMAAGGRYAQLFQVQSKYYQEGEVCHEF